MPKNKKTSSSSKPDLPAVSSYLLTKMREVAFILLLAFSVFLLIALCTYHSLDPSWSFANTGVEVQNSAGAVGAWLSDLLLCFLGTVSYLLPPMLFYAGCKVYKNRRSEAQHTWGVLCVQWMALLLVLFSVSGLIAIHFAGNTMVPYHPGGVLGVSLRSAMIPSFNVVGTTCVLLTTLALALLIYSGFSFFQCLDAIGLKAIAFSKFLYGLFDRVAFRVFFLQCRTKLGYIYLNYLERRKDSSKDSPVARKAPNVLKSKPAIAEQVTAEPKVEKSAIQFAKNAVSFSKVVPTPPPAGAHAGDVPHQTVNTKVIPSFDLLDKEKPVMDSGFSEDFLQEKAKEVEDRLSDFGVKAVVTAIRPGPVVTRFEIELAAGTKVSKVSNLAKDLARSLSVMSVRVVEVIPGTSVIGLELPNPNRKTVGLRETLESKAYDQAKSRLTMALGKDISGKPVVVDLAKMPHLLVAGTTGSGKSVSLNAMLLSLLYKSTPEQMRMILIDPKMLELAVYEGIPHLLTPVVTDMRDAAKALRWCVAEMERRYHLMAALGVRNLAGYNEKVIAAQKAGKPIVDPIMAGRPGMPQANLEPMPQIVVLADEFADMMVVVGKKVETLIARLAQKARAAGIHLILATQRPSVDVITGLIKANIPTRIAFQVSSKVDSRTILDQGGAEQLLGNGDMLYLPPGTGVPIRVHGAYVSDEEVHQVVDYLRSQSAPNYSEEILEAEPADPAAATQGDWLQNIDDEAGEKDELYDQAVEMVVQSRRVSVSSVQRRFKIGYNRAARIVDSMQDAGVVSAMESNGSREVLVPAREQ